MIAKKTGLKNVRGAKALASYIAAAKEKGEKLEHFWMTNCKLGDSLEDLDLVTKEIMATQKGNKTSKADPNYHLIVSFADDEHPDKETLKEIEEEFAKTLGFEEHQRVVGTHINTDNFHMHIMFNKVHPETLCMHTPFRDFKVLQETCAKLERKYGLKVVQGRDKANERRFENHKAKDVEAETWEQSFSTYLKDRRDALLVIKEQSSTWAEFHDGIDRFGLILKKRGNGLVFADQTGKRHERASVVDREFSKKRMEDKYGPFIPIEKDRIGKHTKERYGKKPLDPRLEKHAAWRSYKRRKRGNWRGFLEEMSPLNAEAREALEIQSNYLSIFFGGKVKRSKPRDIQPRKGRPIGMSR